MRRSLKVLNISGLKSSASLFKNAFLEIQSEKVSFVVLIDNSFINVKFKPREVRDLAIHLEAQSNLYFNSIRVFTLVLRCIKFLQ